MEARFCEPDGKYPMDHFRLVIVDASWRMSIGGTNVV